MISYIITFLAGCSTLIGYFFIYLNNDSNKVLISSLGFASGVMILISLYDLIPASFNLINKSFFIIPSILFLLLFLVLGIIISMSIDKYMPGNDYFDHKLFRVGMISMLAIIIHNVPEGIATFLTSTHNLELGITLAISLALHNIPEGISVSIPIYYSTGSKKKAFIYTFISGMSEFLGAVIASLFLKNLVSDLFMGFLYSLIAGIMIHISLYELLPTSLKYKNYLRTIIYLAIGIVFMFISCILI